MIWYPDLGYGDVLESRAGSHRIFLDITQRYRVKVVGMWSLGGGWNLSLKHNVIWVSEGSLSQSLQAAT
jgi:hypothetical protein